MLDENMVANKPIITYCGAENLFRDIESLLQQSLPQEPCDWYRSTNHHVKKVNIGATFMSFNDFQNLNTEPLANLLLTSPVFHIYWVDCPDVDTYKAQTKSEIDIWFSELQRRHISDWMIVLVESFESKRTTKLLQRTTVLDKLRSDFGANKSGDRCVSVFNPKKSENRYSDSWRSLNNRIRLLLLTAYDKGLKKIEDQIRKERESRNDVDWDLLKVFGLQEHLAAIFEMLGIYDEALIQYDELDSLIGQIINERLRITPTMSNWFDTISQPINQWHGLRIMEPVELGGNPSLIQLRTYLFSKQAQLLLLDLKPVMVASRLLPFVFTTLNELELLEVKVERGSMACWAFLNSFEVLQVCENFKDVEYQETIRKCSAFILEYCVEKLRILGDICGLMPNQTPSSEYLHSVVQLSAGMGDCSSPAGRLSPTDRLKQALLSKDTFQELFIELSELAINTYRRMGYYRSSALVSKNMAQFYLDLNQNEKALSCLINFTEVLGDVQWTAIIFDVNELLLKCYKNLNDHKKYAYCCSILATVQSNVRDEDALIYFNDMMSYKDPAILKLGQSCFLVMDVVLNKLSSYQQNEILSMSIGIDNRFPHDVANVSIELNAIIADDETVNCCSNGNEKKIDLLIDLAYTQDNQISSASIVINPCARETKGSKMSILCDTGSKILKRGLNSINFKSKLTELGCYKWDTMKIKFFNFEHVTKISSMLPNVMVLSLEPDVQLVPGENDLIVGFQQKIQLQFTINSFQLDSDEIKIQSSKGLRIKYDNDDPFSNEITIRKELFDCQIIEIDTITDKTDQSTNYELKVIINENLVKILNVLYSPLFCINSKTVVGPNCTKFLEVHIALLHSRKLVLDYVELVTEVEFTKNFVDSEAKIKMNFANDCAKFVWQILENAPTHFDAQLRFKYTVDDESSHFRKLLNVQNLPVMYVISEDIEPFKDTEFCRSGFMCNLKLTVTKLTYDVTDNDEDSIMFEILPQQNLWGMCNKTSGVINNDSMKQGHTIILEMMPLTNGFLPMPEIRISKYIQANRSNREASLEEIDASTVYNCSETKQIHILSAANID